MTGLRVAVEPVAVTPGRPGVIRVTITNGGDDWRTYVVRPIGFDEEWVPASMVVDPVGPQSSVTVDVPITMPAGYPACEYRAAISVQPTILGNGKSAEPPVSADAVVVVTDVTRLFASLDPADVQGRDRAKLEVVLCNRGVAAVNVDLTASAPPGLAVRFAQTAVVLTPGREIRVRTKVHRRRRGAGHDPRLPF